MPYMYGPGQLTAPRLAHPSRVRGVFAAVEFHEPIVAWKSPRATQEPRESGTHLMTAEFLGRREPTHDHVMGRIVNTEWSENRIQLGPEDSARTRIVMSPDSRRQKQNEEDNANTRSAMELVEYK